jgi:hypothetical protein
MLWIVGGVWADGVLAAARPQDPTTEGRGLLPPVEAQQEGGRQQEGAESGGSAGGEAEGGESEEGDELETDRDAFTPSAKAVGLGRTIVEASYSFIDNRHTAETHSFPEVLIRRGLTERLELRLGWNYEIGGGNSIFSGNPHEPGLHAPEIEQESRLLYGLKAGLTEQRGWRPESALIVQGSTPTSGEESLTLLSVTPVLAWTTQQGNMWGVANRFQTSGNEAEHFNLWSPSMVFKVPITERMRGHVEYIGVFSDQRETATAQHFISPGIHHLLNRDLEIGWRAGWGLSEQSPNFFINFGIGRRF